MEKGFLTSNKQKGQTFYRDNFQAEAMIHLDRVDKAVEHLKQALKDSSNVLRNVSSEEYSKNVPNVGYPKSCSQAKAVVHSNMAGAYALLNNMDRASKQLSHLTELIPPDIVSNRTVLLAVYIALKENNRAKALEVLKTRNISHFNLSKTT